MVKKLLDLFCGAGGAGEGYRLAGFDVTGVDINPQPNNPHRFVQADAIEYLLTHGGKYDVIHASPPCQRWSIATRTGGDPALHPDLITPIRDILQSLNKPYVIENVKGAPLQNPLMLNHMMFGLLASRERYFETHPLIYFTPIPVRRRVNVKMGRKPDRKKHYIVPVGNFSDVEFAHEAMGITWKMTTKEIAQAIPPAFTKYIGDQILKLSRLPE